MPQGIRVSEQTWPEIEVAFANKAIAILPIAASCKQHGRHLPMATDYIQTEWLVSQLIKQINAVVWPSISYGYYPAFVDYPGSCSLNETTFATVVVEIIQNIIDSGAKEIYLLNSGISTIRPLEKVISPLSSSINIHLINIYSGKHFCNVEKTIKQQARGSHADEIETSIMLAIAPEKVKMELADTCIIEKQTGPLNRTQPDQVNYSPSGVYGDARLATVEKGQALVTAMLKDVLQILR